MVGGRATIGAVMVPQGNAGLRPIEVVAMGTVERSVIYIGREVHASFQRWRAMPSVFSIAESSKPLRFIVTMGEIFAPQTTSEQLANKLVGESTRALTNPEEIRMQFFEALEGKRLWAIGVMLRRDSGSPIIA